MDVMVCRYFIYLSYKGTAYHGWQIQPNGISVQQMLTDALSTVLRQQTEVVGAGRTDAGVHAKLMVAHFDCVGGLPNGLDLTNKLNSLLPNDIAVHQVLPVKPGAHARFDAVSRKYEYYIVTAKDVFKQEFAARIVGDLDFQQMNIAAATLLDFTDFTSFSKLHTDVKTNNCKITQAQWNMLEGQWVFTVQADRFLRNMVRAIVGTLLEVGRGKLSVEQFKEVVMAKNRCKAGVSVPAKGLFLVDICYPDSIFYKN